jgi:hypothetical protein
MIPAGLALLYVLWPRSEPIAKTKLPPAASGWEELGNCVAAQSFDGSKSLTLLPDGNASLDNTSADDPKEMEQRQLFGTWKYDAASKRYAVVLKGETVVYQRLSIADSDLCMLIKGDLGAADLYGSWFSDPDRVEDDPREHEDRR